MNEAYQKLGEGLPARREPRNIGFPTEPKRVRPWIEGLPRANQAQTQRHLADALGALAEVRLEGAQRLAILEQLRPVLLEVTAGLSRVAQAATFPLPPTKARAMAQLQEFERSLALGYRLAVIELCAPAGNVPLMRGGSVAQALERTALHYSRALMHAYAVYQAPPEGLWQALHDAWRFALAQRLEDRAVEDEAEDGKSTIRQVYAQALLLALSNPYRFSQREQAELWTVSRVLARHLSIVERRPSAEAFAIPVGSDIGPGYIVEERVEDDGGGAADAMWMDVTPLRLAMERPLADTESGPVRIRLPGGDHVDSTAELLRRLRGGWGNASTRGQKRLQAEHALDTVVGLSGIHYHLAEGRDFEAFMRQTGMAGVVAAGDRHDWAQPTGSAAQLPVYRASVLDQSLGGYRIRWPVEQPVRARVGELIGLGLVGDDDRQWMLGIVRWLRYAADGSVDGGIELLARRARAVGVRSVGGGGRARPQAPSVDLRGIEFNALRNIDGGSLRLVVPNVLDLDSGAIEVMRVAHSNDIEIEEPMSETCRDARVVENAGDYMVVSALRTRVDE